MFEVKILCDSLSEKGARLTTMELTYPRFVHAEFMTHRMFSRNAASSRAIPIEKMIDKVLKNPVIPVYWGKNQKGMQASEELNIYDQAKCESQWLAARDEAIEVVQYLSTLGVHKQIVNRLLEPWMWITVICSATEWDNFFKLRCHPDAQPEIQKLAFMMRETYTNNEPELVTKSGVCAHRPLIFEEDYVNLYNCDLAIVSKDVGKVLDAISVGRCARVSYLTHDGKRDLQADIDLHDRLWQSGHWSPFEHVAYPSDDKNERSGNFIGWIQYRQLGVMIYG